MSEDERKEVSKRLIIEEIKRFSELYKPKEGIGEQGLDELANKILSFSKDYISKDKIREKIKEYREETMRCQECKDYEDANINQRILLAFDKLLEE